MNKNKCTLLIDGNWLMMSRLFVVQDYFKIGLSPEEQEIATNQLLELMSRSITTTLQKFDTVVDNIVVVTEGGSWRKQLPKPSSLQDTIYKGNRSLSNTIDWDLIWKSAGQFFDKLKELGITVSKVSGMEGDDMIYYWSRKLNQQGINCIIWSSDQDLQQLVQYRNCVFTIWYENKGGLYLPASLQPQVVDPIEFFMQVEQCGNNIIDILKKNFKATYINPDDIVMKKIICGDSGDNIKSIIRQPKGSKVYKVSEKLWDKVKKNLNISSLKQFISMRDEICDTLIHEKQYGDLTDVKDEFDYNIKLVWLNSEVIPEKLIEQADEIPYNIYEVSNIKMNYKLLCGDDEEDEAMKVFESLPF